MSARTFAHRVLPRSLRDRARAVVVREFSRMYYERQRTTWGDTWWMGQRVAKNPCDLWVYQELLWRLEPALIVETGTLYGGSALYLASILDDIGAGRVITIDIAPQATPEHRRIEYVVASSTDPAVVESVRTAAAIGPVLVILDSDHSRDHVLAELRAYADIVSPGSYLIVEDTNINGHPIRTSTGPGPMEAVDTFLREDPRFVVDSACEKHMLTHNPRGFLRRSSE